jgi:3-oxoadipate enol-lactonase
MRPAEEKAIAPFIMDDGCHLAVRILKPGIHGAPTLLAIHALAMNGTMWADVSDTLTPNIRMLALDCRGHGLSCKPEGPYSLARFVKDVLNIVDALACERVVLAGCSMGGTIALGFAGAYPERVAGLSVFDTTAWYGEDAPAKWEQRAQTVLSRGMSALADFQLDRWFSPEFRSLRKEVVDRALSIFLANDPAAYAEACRMLGHADERERVGQYKGPALIGVGEHDYATPLAMAEGIVSRMTQARIRVFPHARHFTPFEVPEMIGECLRQIVMEAGKSH